VAHGLNQEAKKILETILEQRKEHIPTRMLLGEVLMKTGHPEEAVKLFEGVARDDEDQVEARSRP
jgi:cytochrome c-type biogenesis protein CcmH/NrfG